MGKEPNESAAARPLTEKVAVPLSDREVAELGMKLAETRARTGRMEREKKDVDTDYNAKLKTLEAEQDTLAKQINERQSEIDVAVKEVPDDARKMVCIVRLDNGALLRTREMTTKEKGEAFTRKQPGLPGMLEGTDLVDAADKQEGAASPFDGNDLGLPGRGDENGPGDEEDDADAPPAEDDEPADPRDTERPPPADDVIEHKGQQLRRVPRGHQPDAPKGA
jgi:hypothetical protein